ncbi:MAG: YrdB family protein [Bacteroidetes bacterium]|nr:YrdB family protein [Bacteroidota bacterium]
MSIIKPIHLLIAFLLEVAMLFCLGYYGFHSNMGNTGEFILGIGLPIIAIVLWGFLAAPKAKRRLPFPYLIVFKLVLFLLTALLLYKSGQPKWALVFAVIAIISESLEIIFRDKHTAEESRG